MTNAAKAKGVYRWEAPLREWLRSAGLPAFQPRQEGFGDVGDLHGLSPFIAQAKNWKDTTAALREGVDGAEVQARRAGEDYGVAFIKRARASVARGYAVTTVRTFALFLRRLNRAETLLARVAPDLYAAHMEKTADDISSLPGA